MAHQSFFTLVKITFHLFRANENNHQYAGVAELADALDLGSSAARRGGSTPFTRTKIFRTIIKFIAEVVQW